MGVISSVDRPEGIDSVPHGRFTVSDAQDARRLSVREEEPAVTDQPVVEEGQAPEPQAAQPVDMEGMEPDVQERVMAGSEKVKEAEETVERAKVSTPQDVEEQSRLEAERERLFEAKNVVSQGLDAAKADLEEKNNNGEISDSQFARQIAELTMQAARQEIDLGSQLSSVNNLLSNMEKDAKDYLRRERMSFMDKNPDFVGVLEEFEEIGGQNDPVLGDAVAYYYKKKFDQESSANQELQQKYTELQQKYEGSVAAAAKAPNQHVASSPGGMGSNAVKDTQRGKPTNPEDSMYAALMGSRERSQQGLA